ncbi:MAG TPA: PaaI family thioesterase [Acidimicrobiales bacterium]
MPPRRDAAEAHRQVLEAGEHLFQQLELRDVEVDGADFAMEMPVSARVTNPRGGLQGGLVATLADIVAGRAAFAALDPGANAATSDLTVHYLAPLTEGPARAVATVLRRGRTKVVVRVDIHDVGAGRLAAASTVTYTVLPPLPRS